MKIQTLTRERIFRLFVAKAGEHWDEISRVWFRDVSDTLDCLTPEEIRNGSSRIRHSRPATCSRWRASGSVGAPFAIISRHDRMKISATVDR